MSDTPNPSPVEGAPTPAGPQVHKITVRGQEREVTQDQLLRLAASGANAQELLAQAQQAQEANQQALATYQLMHEDPNTFLQTYLEWAGLDPAKVAEAKANGEEIMEPTAAELKAMRAELAELRSMFGQSAASNQIQSEIQSIKARDPEVDVKEVLLISAQTGKTVTAVYEEIELAKLRRENAELKSSVAKREGLVPSLPGRPFGSTKPIDRKSLTIEEAFAESLGRGIVPGRNPS